MSKNNPRLTWYKQFSNKVSIAFIDMVDDMLYDLRKHNKEVKNRNKLTYINKEEYGVGWIDMLEDERAKDICDELPLYSYVDICTPDGTYTFRVGVELDEFEPNEDVPEDYDDGLDYYESDEYEELNKMRISNERAFDDFLRESRIEYSNEHNGGDWDW